MATPSLATASYSLGRLYKDPTDATLGDPNTAPFGGTALGLIQSVALIPTRVREFQIPMGEYGGEGGDVVEHGSDYLAIGLLRGFDADNLGAIFASVSAGAVTGDPLVTLPGITPGSMASARGYKLAYVPLDEANRGWIAYLALPSLRESQEITYRVQQPNTIAVVWRLVRGSGGVSLREGRPQDLIP